MVELTADRGDSPARVRKLVALDGGDAEKLETKSGTVAPHATPGRAAPQGATREVDRLLDLERIPPEICALDIERAEGIRQAARGEDRRIDRAGERPDSIECSLDLRSQLLEQTARSGRVGVEKLPRELERHHRRGEILLNAVVQGLLDPPALPVEVGEHVERVSRRVGGGQHDRGRGQARCRGEAEERSVSETMKGDRERFLADGFDGYLEKPIRVRELPDQVGTHLA